MHPRLLSLGELTVRPSPASHEILTCGEWTATRLRDVRQGEWRARNLLDDLEWQGWRFDAHIREAPGCAYTTAAYGRWAPA
jgi:hypothetical protein